jgi:hypothetical protein
MYMLTSQPPSPRDYYYHVLPISQLRLMHELKEMSDCCSNCGWRLNSAHLCHPIRPRSTCLRCVTGRRVIRNISSTLCLHTPCSWRPSRQLSLSRVRREIGPILSSQIRRCKDIGTLQLTPHSRGICGTPISLVQGLSVDLRHGRCGNVLQWGLLFGDAAGLG